MTDTIFPYGTVPLDTLFRARYLADYSEANVYPLPDALPAPHPLLARLEGTYALHDRLAPWWPACVAQIEHPGLRALLATLSLQEFREGMIEPMRWKQFRQALSEHERAALPGSPKLASLLEHTDWSYAFTQRGPKDTPAHLDLLISCAPLHALYMSNGDDWTSCQHFRDGDYNHHLPGNFYDTGVATVMALAPRTNVWDRGVVLARTTLRVFCHEGRSVAAIGHTYHNNDTLAIGLWHQLAELLDQQQIHWGFLSDVNSAALCCKGFLGPELKQRYHQAENTRMRSEPFWLPSNWSLPYVDCGAHFWERIAEETSYRLHATVRLMPPLSASPALAA